MKTIKLTNEEIRALSMCLNKYQVCTGSCAFEEMQYSEKDCDECEFPKLLSSIEDKITK